MHINIKEMPEEITVLVRPCAHAKYGFLYLDNDPEHDDSAYISIGDPVEVTFKLGTREQATNAVIGKLKQEQTRIRADSEMKCVALEEKVQQLLAITDKT